MKGDGAGKRRVRHAWRVAGLVVAMLVAGSALRGLWPADGWPGGWRVSALPGAGRHAPDDGEDLGAPISSADAAELARTVERSPSQAASTAWRDAAARGRVTYGERRRIEQILFAESLAKTR